MTSLYTATKHPEQLEATPLIEESHHYDDPLEPQKLVFLDAVNKQRCVINSPQRNSQLTNTIPFFIVLLVMACYTLFGFVDNHLGKKTSMEQMSKYLQEKYSYLSEDKIRDNRSVVLYSPFFHKEKISWWEYIKAYNSGKYFTDSQYGKYLVIGWLIFFPGFLWLLGYLSFFTPPVYLIADRQRGILYSYGMGKVRLTRYEDAQFGYAGKMLAIKLYGIDEKTGQLKTILYRPNVSHYSSFLTSTDSENHRFITFLNAYMQEGRDAVSSVDYQARKPFLSFGKNPLPVDFEQQVEQILAKLDQEKNAMRSLVNGRKLILKNDTTNTGGTVLTASSLAKQTQGVACVGDSVYCPSCKKTGTIVEGDSLMKINGIPVALEGHKVACGCSGGCVLVAVG